MNIHCSLLKSIFVFTRFIACGLMLLTLPIIVMGAEIDYRESNASIEDTIYKNRELNNLDKRLAAVLKKAIYGSFAHDDLQKEQREWITKIRNDCQDASCLKRVYVERIESLKIYDQWQRTMRNERICEFPGLMLPKSYTIFAARCSRGRELGSQIDQSGDQATQMDVAVNFSSNPVVLILSAYAPTIWNISWSKDTRIVAVLVSGYLRQVVAGLDPSVPMLITSRENGGACGYFHAFNEDELEKIVNPISIRLFRRPIDVVYWGDVGSLAKKGEMIIGDPLPAGIKLITSKATPPQSFYNERTPRAGRTGLEDALKRGILRKATSADGDAWVNAVIANIPKQDLQQSVGHENPAPRRPETYDAYVVLKSFSYPAGLHGDDMPTFFIPRGVPEPKGDPGDSCVCDFKNLKCKGPFCSE